MFSFFKGSNSSSSAAAAPASASAGGDGAQETNKQEKPKLKPCCACPETKRARDACIMENGEEGCAQLIEAHKQCMRDLGFKI